MILVVVLLFGRGKISDLMGDVAKGIKSFKKGLADETDARATTSEVARAAAAEDAQVGREGQELIWAAAARTDRAREPSMFDFGIGYTELMVIALVAIIVIGPKDLPKVLRAFGRTMTARCAAWRASSRVISMQAMRETGIDEVKKDTDRIRCKNLDRRHNPICGGQDLPTELKKQDDDFKKYFGELRSQPSLRRRAGCRTGEAADARPNRKVPDNDLDKYFAEAR